MNSVYPSKLGDVEKDLPKIQSNKKSMKDWTASEWLEYIGYFLLFRLYILTVFGVVIAIAAIWRDAYLEDEFLYVKLENDSTGESIDYAVMGLDKK